MSAEPDRRAPRALLMDIGLTVVHPNGHVMLEELRRVAPDALGGASDRLAQELVAALVLAAEARHLRLPDGDGDTRVATTWGMLLGLPADVALRAWHSAMARPDLYDGLDPTRRRHGLPFLAKTRRPTTTGRPVPGGRNLGKHTLDVPSAAAERVGRLASNSAAAMRARQLAVSGSTGSHGSAWSRRSRDRRRPRGAPPTTERESLAR